MLSCYSLLTTSMGLWNPLSASGLITCNSSLSSPPMIHAPSWVSTSPHSTCTSPFSSRADLLSVCLDWAHCCHSPSPCSVVLCAMHYHHSLQWFTHLIPPFLSSLHHLCPPFILHVSDSLSTPLTYTLILGYFLLSCTSCTSCYQICSCTWIPIPLVSPWLGNPTSASIRTFCHPCSHRYKGAIEYLENLVTFIDAPKLNHFRITFFNQTDFDCSELVQFINHTPRLRALDKALVRFDDGSTPLQSPPYVTVVLIVDDILKYLF